MQNTQNTNQTTNENLRVLILAQADIQRLQALLAQEITFNTEFMQAATEDYMHYKILDQEEAKSIRNFISARKKKLKNLANLQYKLKHETLYPINAAIMFQEVLYDN